MDNWQLQAACTADQTSMFFSDDPAKRAAAKATCAACPVLAPCRQFALDRPKLQGVFGGLTASERQAMRAAGSSKRTRWTDGSTGARDAGPRAAGVL